MNTSNSKVRFTLTNPSDVDSLPLAPELKALVRDKFQEIWSQTPHKIGVAHLHEVLEEVFQYEGGETAGFLKGVQKGQVVSMLDVIFGDVVVGIMHVVRDGCFTYVPVEWELSMYEGQTEISFTPQLESVTVVGEIPFADFMRRIDRGFYTRGVSFYDTLASVEDHPDFKFALQSEVKSVMRAYVLALAGKYGLSDEIILPKGHAAVETEVLRELLLAVGYDPEDYEVDEEQVIAMARAILADNIPAELVESAIALTANAGYDQDDFEVDEELILKVMKAVLEAENRAR